MWDVQKVLVRLQKENKLPKYLLMENVPAIFNIKNKPGFDKWKDCLESMGYNNTEQMLNAKYFGVPQNRNRAFMVSILKDDLKGDLSAYSKDVSFKKIKDILEIKQDYNFVSSRGKNLSLGQVEDLKPKINSFGMKSSKIKDYTNFASENRIFFEEGITGTLTATGAQSRLKFPDFKTNKIRLITPLESWRLMGFEDEDFNRANSLKMNTDIILIKQAGNSIVVPVLEHIFEQMFKDGEW